MSRAPHHAFFDQLASRWGKRCDFSAQLIRDLPGAMRPRAELGHGSQVSLFQWRKPIETYAEEARVQGGHRCQRGGFDIVEVDRGFICRVPRVFASLLQKIRVAVCLGDNAIQRLGFDFHAFVPGRLLDRVSGRFRWRRTVVRKIEQSLGGNFTWNSQSAAPGSRTPRTSVALYRGQAGKSLSTSKGIGPSSLYTPGSHQYTVSTSCASELAFNRRATRSHSRWL